MNISLFCRMSGLYVRKYVFLQNIMISHLMFVKIQPQAKGQSGLKAYMLQEDASEDGAATEQQRQQADQSHQDIEELPSIALS